MSENKNSFLKNVLTLAAGTSVAQVITILVSPLLSRLFTPEDFALFAAFTSIAGIFTIIATGKYEKAILLPSTECAAVHVLFGIILWSGFVSVCSPFVVLLLSYFSAVCSLIVANKLLLYFVIFTFCSATLEALRYYFVRIKQFQAISLRTILGSFITVVLNLIGGYFFRIPTVFVISTTIAQILCLLLFVLIAKKTVKLSWFSLSEIKKNLLEYKKFPLFTMPGQILNTITGSLPILVFSSLYSQHDIGQYALVQKCVSVPMVIIGNSIQQVFLQRFSTLQTIKEQRVVFIKSFLYLFMFISFCAIPCVIFATPLFLFVFGEQWVSAAHLAKVLAPMYVLQFAITPVSGAVYIIHQKLKIEFALQILRFVLVAGGVLLVFILKLPFIASILVFSFSMALWYFVTLLFSFVVLGKLESGYKS